MASYTTLRMPGCYSFFNSRLAQGGQVSPHRLQDASLFVAREGRPLRGHRAAPRERVAGGGLDRTERQPLAEGAVDVGPKQPRVVLSGGQHVATFGQTSHPIREPFRGVVGPGDQTGAHDRGALPEHITDRAFAADLEAAVELLLERVGLGLRGLVDG